MRIEGWAALTLHEQGASLHAPSLIGFAYICATTSHRVYPITRQHKKREIASMMLEANQASCMAEMQQFVD